MTNTVENIDLKQLGAEIDSLCQEITGLLSKESASGISAAEPAATDQAAYTAARQELLS
jgi:hypothetical protein